MKLPKARITLDLDYKLLEWVTRYAGEHGKSRNEAIGEAVKLLREQSGREDIAELIRSGAKYIYGRRS